jgi:hypothetical protein
MFHHNVAKLLFLSSVTALAFLCTCVKAPDTYDYKKRVV